jgi:hypothetical protein
VCPLKHKETQPRIFTVELAMKQFYFTQMNVHPSIQNVWKTVEMVTEPSSKYNDSNTNLSLLKTNGKNWLRSWVYIFPIAFTTSVCPASDCSGYRRMALARSAAGGSLLSVAARIAQAAVAVTAVWYRCLVLDRTPIFLTIFKKSRAVSWPLN